MVNGRGCGKIDSLPPEFRAGTTLRSHDTRIKSSHRLFAERAVIIFLIYTTSEVLIKVIRREGINARRGVRRALEDDGKYFIKALLPRLSKGVHTSTPISANFVKRHVALCACRAENEQVRALKATARNKLINWQFGKTKGGTCDKSCSFLSSFETVRDAMFERRDCIPAHISLRNIYIRDEQISAMLMKICSTQCCKQGKSSSAK